VDHAAAGADLALLSEFQTRRKASAQISSSGNRDGSQSSGSLAKRRKTLLQPPQIVNRLEEVYERD
jgi:hypothetical protein